jgi:PKD repeat protein
MMKNMIRNTLLTIAGLTIFNSYSQCPPTYSNISEIVCDNYLSPSGNYNWTLNGIYVDTIPNFMACDSIITINLTVNPLPIVYMAADLYSGCAPLNVTFTPTITPISTLNTWDFGDGTIVSNGGGSITHNYFAGGIWDVMLTATTSFGCTDSLTFSSWIYTEPANVDLGDTIVSCTNEQVLDAGAGFWNYLWSTGETTQSITVNIEGNYSAIVYSAMGCSDTSTVFVEFLDCASLESVQNAAVILYPNPVSDWLTIENLSPKSEITLVNVLGERFYIGFSDINGVFSANIAFLANGFYTILLKNNTNFYTTKFEKQ